ncbi:MAG: SDR family NAD(P)-dependent oxidoreductase [Deltaproteobacteria bacterium]|nr:SDR family NAD(P)-dependent oxidoreductase [Deltaproteobacteria bacterium]
MEIKGKIALVTGGAKRIGREIALALGRKGVPVALHYHSSANEAQELKSLFQKEGQTLQLFQADLREKTAIEKMAREVEKKMGPVSLLINNASIFVRTPFNEINDTHWEENWKLHLLAPFWLARSLTPGMKKMGEGKIINIVDRSIFHPFKNHLPYTVTKAALAALTQGLALELAPEIQVNAIAPGILLPAEGSSKSLKKEGTPEELIRTLLGLIESDSTTGSIVSI